MTDMGIIVNRRPADEKIDFPAFSRPERFFFLGEGVINLQHINSSYHFHCFFPLFRNGDEDKSSSLPSFLLNKNSVYDKITQHGICRRIENIFMGHDPDRRAKGGHTHGLDRL
jgi:hypothetical protein